MISTRHPADLKEARAVLQELRQLERETTELLLLRRLDALDRVQDAVQRIGEIGSPAGLLDRAAEGLGKASRFDRVLISQVHGGELTPHALWLSPNPADADLIARVTGVTVRLDYPLIEAELAARPGTEIVSAKRSGPRTPKALQQLLGWDTYVVAALRLRGTTIGLIHADAPLRGEPVDELDREIATAYADGLTGAFERAVLRATLDRHRSELRLAVTWMNDHLDRTGTAGRGVGRPDGAAEPVPGVDALTRREREVLDQMARGRTNVAIAGSLLITESTVKFHVKNVLLKLGASSRADAVARHMRAGR